MSRTVILIIGMNFLLVAGEPLQMDQRLTASLQGSNQYPYSDYFWESFALGTPVIEFGAIIYRIQSGETQDSQELITVMTSTQLTAVSLKYLFKRKRPERHYHPRLMNTRITPSFPAGHAASSAALATNIALHYPDTKFLMAGYALFSGYSQIYVGNHFVSDVLAGWVIGYTAGYLSYKMLNKQDNTSSTLTSNNTLVLKIIIPL